MEIGATSLLMKSKIKISVFKILLVFISFGSYSSGYGQQDRMVTGTVKDGDTGEMLPGVNIIVKGTAMGAVSNIEGQYTISVPDENGILLFSFIGYVTEEVPVNSRSVIEVSMDLDIESLDEVVIIGYGSQKKQDVTGAISSISKQALEEVPVTNAPQMLQGRAAGVSVVSAGNKPGAGVTVQIRGRRSFNAGNDPLYVIDGIPITGGFNDINPNDIESIEVLKDASSTAIYGSRGANGVIIITTKRGALGKATVSYNNWFGISKITEYPDIMNGSEFAEYKRESRRAVIDPTTGLPLYNDADPEADSKLFEAVELQSIAEGRSTDWPRLMIKNGYSQNHDLSISGGSETTRFNISMGYFNDIGIIDNQDFKRYATRINIDQYIGDRFKVGMSTLGSYSERNGEDVNPYGPHSDFGALTENPLGIPYDENGNLIFRPTSDGLRTNPLSELVPGAVINRGKRFRLFSSLYGEAEIAEGLKFKMNFGPDLIQSRKGDFRGSHTNSRQLGSPAAYQNENFDFSYTWENIITYNKVLKQKHNFDFTGLYSLQSLQSEQSNISVIGLPVEFVEYYNFGAASIINGVGSGFEKRSILSYMARLHYSYSDRFLVTLTGRADGSSKFYKDKKWGYFPSIALAWNVGNEKFLKDYTPVSNLKLRISYGEIGNEGIAPYQTNGLLTRTVYDFDGEAAFGYRPSSIRNNDLKWETTASLNVGVDFGLFNGRINGTLEIYKSKTTDLLLPQLLPITSGYGSILSNVGAKGNKGLEFSLSTLNIRPKTEGGFQWSTDLNLFTNQEEILELSLGKVDDVGNARFIGHPATVYYDYVKLGIWQLGEEDAARQFNSSVGGVKVQDTNGNGSIDPDDRQILGSDVPKLIGGMTHRFKYKGFDLSALTFARFGSMIVSPVYGGFRFLSGRVNQYNVDYWTPDNPTNAFPRPNSNLESPYFGSTLRYFDGSFVKIRNINLGYSFSVKLLQDIKIQSLRVYLGAQNPFVFSSYTSKYNGIDPENPTTSTPPFRTFLVGLNVKF